MEIMWYGHSCFRITERGHTSVVTDPYEPAPGLPELKLKADLVTVSHGQPDHQAVNLIRGHDYVIAGAGEYEIGELFVTGIPMHVYDEEQARVRENVAYLFEYPNHLTVLHLGNLHQMPDQSTIEQLGEVHVLLAPVDGGQGRRGDQVMDVIALVEPNYVAPMRCAMDGAAAEPDSIERFLKAMGVSQPEEKDTLRVTASSLPEQTQIVLLRAHRGQK